MKKKTVKRQVRLAIASNAGGSGKTTMAVHLAYAVASRGYKVALMELDLSGSLRIFAGLTKAVPEQSTAILFQKKFDGAYPLVPLWSERVKALFAIQGGEALERSTNEIYFAARRYYILGDCLEKYPLDADLIVFDTPAALEPMGLAALAASTHVLVPIKPEYKDTGGFAGLLEWYYNKIDELKLKPEPEILGFVPTRVDLGKATHRNILGIDEKGSKRQEIDPTETLPGQIEGLGIHCFPYVRESNYFLSASGAGLPVHLYRPGCEASKSFDPIVTKLVREMVKE
ncbi:MAG: hypothetical protein N4J56_006711 [Chroococcidiopsis sp. SAG 2025]|uniref:ParA family protein n=1 Tax=Chroococcidiopsis sp. SAG 2025 TaxID=171389 RepID=UPI002936E901|nr:ParA family protein [Chroococcidiopsis sp. SAG 2025]MDV2997006.1 hypothetical protein [Chroococcidiopsis sp. SAG 2025]